MLGVAKSVRSCFHFFFFVFVMARFQMGQTQAKMKKTPFALFSLDRGASVGFCGFLLVYVCVCVCAWMHRQPCIMHTRLIY